MRNHFASVASIYSTKHWIRSLTPIFSLLCLSTHYLSLVVLALQPLKFRTLSLHLTSPYLYWYLPSSPQNPLLLPAGLPIHLIPFFLRLRFGFCWPLCAFINDIYLLTYFRPLFITIVLFRQFPCSLHYFVVLAYSKSQHQRSRILFLPPLACSKILDSFRIRKHLKTRLFQSAFNTIASNPSSLILWLVAYLLSLDLRLKIYQPVLVGL